MRAEPHDRCRYERGPHGRYPSNLPPLRIPLKKWLVPEGASWDEEFFFVCFNDDCSYYQEGWDWMKEQYSQEASYRYMINPTTGASSHDSRLVGLRDAGNDRGG